MIIARQSTARTVMVGPVLDADGVAVTDCVVADFEGSVNGGDPAALNGSATLTHRGVGFYSLALTATDLGTVGSFEVTINDTTNACPMKELTVIEEAIYDALFAASANAFQGAAGSTKVTGVVLTDTLTTYTGNTPQTADHTTNIATLVSRIVGTLASGTHNPQSGDAFARLGLPANASIAADIAAVLSAITGLNNLSALANLYGSPLLEIPDSGSAVYAFTLVVRDNEGKLVALDSSPTIAAANAAGTDRSANLSAVSNPSTGRYTFTYTVANNATPESLRITCSGTVSAEARYVEWIGAVVDYDAQTLIDSIYSIVNSGTFGNQAIKLAVDTAQADLNVITGSDGVTLAASQPNYAPATAAALSTVGTNVSTLLSRIPAALFAGITSIAQWLGSMAGKQTPDSTAQAEMRATGAGNGTFAAGNDSLEALRDRGDAAWTGGGGGGPVAVSVAIPKATARAILEADGTIAITAGDTLRISWEGDNALGDISGRNKLVFTCKRSRAVDDDDAIIQITEADGLVRLNGEAAGTASWGVLTVLDAVAGEVDLVLYASATALLAARQGALWDIKQFLDESPDDAITVTEGTLTVTAGITQATT